MTLPEHREHELQQMLVGWLREDLAEGRCYPSGSLMPACFLRPRYLRVMRRL
jgi:hypothetical protein